VCFSHTVCSDEDQGPHLLYFALFLLSSEISGDLTLKNKETSKLWANSSLAHNLPRNPNLFKFIVAFHIARIDELFFKQANCILYMLASKTLSPVPAQKLCLDFLPYTIRTKVLVLTDSERGGRSLFKLILAIILTNSCSLFRFSGGSRRQDIWRASMALLCFCSRPGLYKIRRLGKISQLCISITFNVTFQNLSPQIPCLLIQDCLRTPLPKEFRKTSLEVDSLPTGRLV